MMQGYIFGMAIDKENDKLVSVMLSAPKEILVATLVGILADTPSDDMSIEEGTRKINEAIVKASEAIVSTGLACRFVDIETLPPAMDHLVAEYKEDQSKFHPEGSSRCLPIYRMEVEEANDTLLHNLEQVGPEQ